MTTVKPLLSVHRAMEVCTIGTHPAHAQVPTCPLGQGTPSTWLRPSARRQVPGAQVPGAQVRVPLRHYDEPFEAPGKKWPTHPLCTLHSVHSALCALPYFPYSLIPYSLFPIPYSPTLPLPYSPLPHSPTRRSPPPSAQRAPRRAPSASLYHRVHALSSHLRPQNHENTVSRPICEVKHGIV